MASARAAERVAVIRKRRRRRDAEPPTWPPDFLKRRVIEPWPLEVKVDEIEVEHAEVDISYRDDGSQRQFFRRLVRC